MILPQGSKQTQFITYRLLETLAMLVSTSSHGLLTSHKHGFNGRLEIYDGKIPVAVFSSVPTMATFSPNYVQLYHPNPYYIL